MTSIILRAVGAATRVFYRHEGVGGQVPSEGPIILVANHPNGLVDPIVLSWTTGRSLFFLAKAPLFSMPVLGFLVKRSGAIPVYRAQDGDDTASNEKTFEAVFDALGARSAVCLFPEGKSHNEPDLQRMKTGAARMALGAEARADYKLGVRIIPIGLVYRAKHRFRSTVATWVGKPIEVGDLAALHRDDEWSAVEKLTERIVAGLRPVTLELDQWEDLPLVTLAERIDSGGATSGAPGARLPRIHAFARQLRVLRAQDPARMEELTLRGTAFRRRLQSLGLGVDDLDHNYTIGNVANFVLRNLFWLLLGFPLVALGYILFALPYWLARFAGHRVRTSLDIYATVQILAGILFLIPWSAAIVVLVGLQLNWSLALFLGLLLIPAGLAALAFHDWQGHVLGDVATFLRLGTRRRLKQALRNERDALALELERLQQ